MTPRRNFSTPCVIFPALLLALAGSAGAHTFKYTDVLVVLKANGTYMVDVTLDVDALVLGVSPTMDSAEIVKALESMPPAELARAAARAQQTLARRIRVRFDGRKVHPTVSFPDSRMPLNPAPAGGDAASQPAGNAGSTRPESALPTLLGITARLVGPIPANARSFTFGASRAFGPLRLTILDEKTASGLKQILGPSEDSPPYRLLDKPVAPSDRPAEATDRSAVWCRYLTLGFTHIIPMGLDHILFVLALFLLSTNLRPLLWQVSAFTVAHTVTLALSVLGVVSLPSAVVEPLIALSIAYVAVENVFTDRLHPWRPALVFGFGLLHGLGFAGVLRELGLPAGRLVEALLTFNVGVELGQLAVIILAFAAVGWARKKPWFRSTIVIPTSLAIGVVGLYWAVTRTISGV